jgi:hypothetical protein
MADVLVLGREEVRDALPLRECIDVMADALAAHARGERLRMRSFEDGIDARAEAPGPPATE